MVLVAQVSDFPQAGIVALTYLLTQAANFIDEVDRENFIPLQPYSL
jgi:hypothetical protein